MEVALPVGRHPAGRARGGLTERMVLRRRQRGPVVVLLSRVVPEPVFARLEAPDDGVAVLLGMVAGVLARRAVATTDMAACRATAEVEPAGPFWEAEPEHQDYLQNYPEGYTCHFVRPGWKLPHRDKATAS